MITQEQKTIRELSSRIVLAQEPIRILDAIKWDEAIKRDFFNNKCEKLPAVDTEYYLKHPLPFNPADKITEFRQIVRDAKNQLGQFSTVTRLIERRAEGYIRAVEMLSLRGRKRFSHLSTELYGGANDAFYLNGPRLCDLGQLLGDVLHPLSTEMMTEKDEKKYTAKEAKAKLQKRLQHFFSKKEPIKVTLDANIIADAAAGADNIKMNPTVCFSERDLKYLEVHEGWVHIGTTINGAHQPYCTFLSKGSPACSVTQEGLAVITEIFTFSSYPARLLKIVNRVKSIDLVAGGANFVDIYRFFKEQGYSDMEGYSYAARVFRGSAPNYGPFTKDLSYSKGFILIYNYIRLAVQQNLTHHIPMFFVGKLLIEEIHDLLRLSEQGLVVPPIYMPPQFEDFSALSVWMSFSLFLNKFDLEAAAKNYHFMLRK